MNDQNKISQMLEVLADNGFGMYDLAILIRSLNQEVITKSLEQLQTDEVLKRRIDKILDEIPIDHHQGREYLMTGIKLAYKCKKETGRKISYMERKVGELHNVTWGMVERYMRVALEEAWKMLNESAVRKYELDKISEGNHRPTNGMFVTVIANYLIKEDCKE